MSWKSLDQIYLQESAGKAVPKLRRQQLCETPQGEELIELIRDLDSKNLLDQETDVNFIKKHLSVKPYAEKIYNYLDKQNLTETTISEGDVRKFIMQILSKHNDVATYAQYIETPVALSTIGNTGMLIEKVAETTKLKPETVRDLINLIGTESGRGVGRGEIALATIFDDVSMSASKGDLDWNGKYLEAKGTNARLGKRDRAASNFNKTPLGQLATQYDKSDKRIDTLIANLANEPGANSEDVFDALKTFAKVEYPHSTIINILDNINLNDSRGVRKALTKIYFDNYANHEGVDYFVFVNTSRNRYFSRYIIFSTDQISTLIDKNIIKAGAITTLDLDPSLGTI